MPTAHICRKISKALILCAGLMVAVLLRAQTLYWDANTTATGAGASPSGTWDTGAGAVNSWIPNSNGTGAIQTWTAGNAAYFSSGAASAGTSYTVTVVGTVSTSGITVAEGQPTFSGGTISFTSGGSLLVDNGATATINSTISGSLSSIADYGTLDLGTAEKLSSTSITLDGTLDIAAGSSAFSSITVSGNSVIDFAGSGTTVLDLSSLTINSGDTLTIKGWTYGTDTLEVNSSPGSSTLGRIDFTGYSNGAGWNSSDDILPTSLVPEPGTYGAIITLCSFGLYYRRFRGQRPKKP
jgi:hypothetical protein